MATIYENLNTIKNNINRMKVALELTETTSLEEVTSKVEEGGGGGGIPSVSSITFKLPKNLGVVTAPNVTIPTVTNITNSIYEEV